jgi:hypothetical protein
MPDHQDLPDPQDSPETMEPQAQLDQRDHPDLQDHPETMDSPVPQDNLDSPEAPEKKESAPNTVPSTVESSSRTEPDVVKFLIIDDNQLLRPIFINTANVLLFVHIERGSIFGNK